MPGGFPAIRADVQLHGGVVAAVERKTVEEDLAASRLFQLEYVRGAAVAEALTEMQARFPTVPVTFCETRQLAQEWTYRWLGACLHELDTAHATAGLETTFASAGPIAELGGPIGEGVAGPRPAVVVRAWARA